MPISSTNRKAGPFIGSGAATTFPFTFKVFKSEDLKVVRLHVGSGVETALTLDSDYTVTLNPDQDSNPGGSITLTAGALATGYKLIISSQNAQKQETDLTSQGGFDPRVITNVFDLVTILIQQIQEQLDRTIKFPTTDSSLSVQLSSAETRAGKILCFGADGSPSLVAMAPSGASLFSGSLSETADGVRTVFTLTNNGSPIGKAPIQVTVWDNYPLVAGTGYNLGPEPGQVTFTTAPQVGDTLFAQGVF